jgi:hypothetical protein
MDRSPRDPSPRFGFAPRGRPQTVDTAADRSPRALAERNPARDYNVPKKSPRDFRRDTSADRFKEKYSPRW